jgi:hypothetical protein
VNRARATQPDLFGLYPAKGIGPLVPSVIAGSNADLIAATAALYIDGTVLDVTYGRGGWWRRYRPADLTCHDLYTLDGVDFRALPEPDRSVDTVCFDPPYVPQGGTSSTAGSAEFRDRYGLTAVSTPYNEVRDDLIAGLDECLRVARRWVLVKCSEFTTGGRLHSGPAWVFGRLAERPDALLHDVIVHHTGSGPGGWNITTQVRARRHHSYLIVVAVRPLTPLEAP